MASGIRKWGSKLIGIWFVLEGLNQLFGLHFEGFSTVMSALALTAGILLILDN